MPYADARKRKEYQTEYRIKYRARKNELAREKRARRSPGEKEKILAERRRRYSKNRDRIRAVERQREALVSADVKAAAKRLKRYKLTPAGFEALLVQQNGVCAICKSKPPLDVDHCHATGQVRGLLCRGCNVGLGQLGDSVEGLQRAIRYLETCGNPLGVGGG